MLMQQLKKIGCIKIMNNLHLNNSGWKKYVYIIYK